MVPTYEETIVTVKTSFPVRNSPTAGLIEDRGMKVLVLFSQRQCTYKKEKRGLYRCTRNVMLLKLKKVRNDISSPKFELSYNKPVLYRSKFVTEYSIPTSREKKEVEGKRREEKEKEGRTVSKQELVNDPISRFIISGTKGPRVSGHTLSQLRLHR